MSFRQTLLSQNNGKGTPKQVYELLAEKQYYLAYSMAKSLEIQQPSTPLYMNIALCLTRIGEEKEAIVYLQKAFQLNHGVPDTSNNQFSLRDLQFLRAEDEDEAYLKPLNPEVEYPLTLLDFRIELLLLHLYMCSKNIDAMKRIISKYRRFQLGSIDKAIQYIERIQENE
ncbi:hypothetical protein acsn021_14200 [Anaerocolumna cellulosilytica]|uniref:Uncharacterized protein n=1 Tax=Anaerocolumna cellulosilytica TaxID=433286 RepID=A0A6S6R414_9FIRM|nr:hypothetical protein [Anaerocolumna cellulosilytica]MBB5195607.1 tetratricopeptide (TPR) repeat protein [Anaerocolumna cellulosilytica]BCJ93851.1 hypothetical protein acsn021_14200 [Anaerocolumna cellulosilytica]